MQEKRKIYPSTIKFREADRAINKARAILRLGPMVLIRRETYGIGTKTFKAGTIKELLANGEIVKIGNGVVSTELVKAALDAKGKTGDS